MKKLAFLIFLLLFNYSFAKEKIKIVYNDGVPPLKFTDVSKNPNGMLIDFWRLWASKNNIEVEFVEASWQDSLQMIKDGRAHIHAGIYHTKKREEFFDYATKPLYKNKNYFFYYHRISQLDTSRHFSPFVIGVGNGYLTTFMKENYPNHFIKEYENEIDAVEDFVSGRSKVILTSMPNFMFYMKNNNIDETKFKYGNETLAFTKEYYAVVKKGNKKLLETINKGFENISDEEFNLIEKNWTIDLNINYLKKHSSKLFSIEEKTHLENKKVINMCVDPDWLPFEKIDDNKHIGMVSQIFNEFEKTLNIPIKLIPTKSWSQSLEYIKSGKCEILSAAAKTKQREEYLNFTNSYLTFPQVIVTREGEKFIEDFNDIKHKKIGVVKDSAIAQLVLKKYPNTNLVEVHNIVDGLFKVNSGKLYGFLNTSAAINYAIAKNGMTKLKVASKVGIDYHLRVAVKKGDDTLVKIFNKVIPSLTNTKIKEIKDKWLHVKVEKVVDYTIVWEIIAGSLFLMLIAVFILYRVNRLKKEVEKQKKEFEKILSLIPVPVLIVSKESKRILFANEYASQTYKIKKDDLVGEIVDILYTKENQREDILSKVDENGVLINYETQYKAKDDSVVDALLSLIPLNFRGVECNLGVITDVTKLKTIQKALEDETIIAKEATSAKSDFLAKMSHEIRTPMNAILGMLYLIEKTQLSNVQDNYVSKASTAAKALLTIVDDILDISKIEAGKLTVENKKFEFGEMLQEIMGIMSYKAEEKGLELLAFYDKNIPSLLISDKLRIGQILNNLLSNAIKFTKEGEVVVSTKLIKIDNGKATIMFCVKDTGVGIDKKSQEKLFKDFNQGDNSITRKYGGTGLGLSISKNLAKMLGGKIWIEESIQNKGTTFCFTVKCEVQNDIVCQDKLFPEHINNLKALIVDDNKVACEVLMDMLHGLGIKVDIAYDGKSAYEAVSSEKNEYDLMFLDYKMPDIDGIQTYKNIKTIEDRKIPKAIMVTAHSQTEIVKESQELGMDGYLIKPASPSILYDTIIETLSQKKVKKIKEQKVEKNEKITFKNASVLLVEDNELNQDFAKELLKAVDIKVTIASNGIEALNLITSKEYDLVLMDIQMPNMDGLTATKHIRKMAEDDEYFTHIPVIALSANASVDDKRKSIDVGMNEHISKPINPKELFGVLSNYIDSETIEENSLETTMKNTYNSEILNAQNIIDKIGGNEELYQDLLEKFGKKYENSYEEILSLIEKNDLEEASKKVHEIKGVAGNLGAYKLFENLSTLNTILKNGSKPKYKLLDEFKVALQRVLEFISKSESIENKDVKEFDKNSVMEVLLKLNDNIEDDIIQAEEDIKYLIPYFENSIYKERLDLVKEYFEEFDTDNAKQTLEELIKEINEA